MTQRIQFAVPVAVCLCSLFAGPLRAVEPRSSAATNAPPESVRLLLEAEGAFEFGRRMFDGLPISEQSRVRKEEQDACERLRQLYPACRALLSKSLDERICMALRDVFRGDLAARLFPEVRVPDVVLAPVYPDDVKLPPDVRLPDFGRVPLIDDEPALWEMPSYWNKPPQPPVFSGWTFEPNAVELAKNCSALVRTDFTLDQAEVTGEFRLDEGEFLFIIMRSDVLLKFHPGKAAGAGGNLNVKFGYDNVRASSVFGKADEILAGKWYSFRAILEDDELSVSLDGKEIIRAPVAADPRLRGSRLAHSGRFGFGAHSARGGFRNVQVKALTPEGMRAVPRLRAPADWAPLGPPIRMLDGKPDDYVSLVHGTAESYKPDSHPIAGGVLTLRGAPYVQLSRKDFESDHFKVAGKIKFLSQGSVWLRVNNTLLFGLNGVPAEPPFPVKHGTGNFNAFDEENQGAEIKLNEEYPWEIEYHEPVGRLRFGGKTAMIAMARTGRDTKKAGANRFGISSYNTHAELRDVVLQKLARGRVPGADDGRVREQVARLFKLGTDRVKDAKLKIAASAPGPGAALATGILDGKKPAETVSDREFGAVAERFRDARNWPAYLALLEANIERFGAGTRNRAEAEKKWKTAQTEYDAILKNVPIGEFGPDNILRVGEETGPMFADCDGRHVWIFLPKGRELIECDAAAGKTERKLVLEVEPAKIVPRRDHLLCVEKEPGAAPGAARRADTEAAEESAPATDPVQPPHAARICKVSLEDGKLLGASPAARGAILDIAGQPRSSKTFFCVDENDKPGLCDLNLFKVYALDEDTMQVAPTDAVGMFLCPDPLGRYLFAGIHVFMRNVAGFDPGPLRVTPQAGHVDHLVRYKIEAGGLVFDSERSGPGLGGTAVQVDPRGGTVCYVAQFGMIRPVANAARIVPAVAAFKTCSLEQSVGTYEVGNQIRFLEFNPLEPESYALAGRQLRVYDTRTFKLTRSIALPDSVAADRAIQLLPAPDGLGRGRRRPR